MKIARRKHLNRIIIVALLTTLLTFNVGRVQSVKAVGTTIALASGAALCTVGIIYCSYMALTGASVHIPDTVQNVESWLKDMGSKVVQYPSGREAYEDVYSRFLRDPSAQLLHDFVDSEVWTWTSDKLRLWANDFSSTDVIESIASFELTNDLSNVVTTDFDYPYTFYALPSMISLEPGGTFYTIQQFMEGDRCILVPNTGATIDYEMNDFNHTQVATDIQNPVRNVLKTNNHYGGQEFYDNAWHNIYSIPLSSGDIIYENSNHKYYIPFSVNGYTVINGEGSTYIDNVLSPPFTNADIYVEATGDIIEHVTVDEIEVVRNPQWPVLHEPDGDKKLPVIPYFQTPFDPNWIDPITGQPGGGRWGFGLDDLLDMLADLLDEVLQIEVLKRLFNDYAENSGDTYYISYDDSVTGDTYYQYNTITNITYGDDIIYQYNIDVSHVEEELPVDLNTIQNYTSNRYLDTIKRSASGIGNVIGEWFAFWHNVDAEIVYVIFGAGILTIIAAFIGKWGHS